MVIFMFSLIWWRFLLFEFVKLRDLTSLKHFHLSVNDLIGSFLYYNVYTTLLSRIFQIVHIASGLLKRGFTLRFFYVEKITCLPALVQNVNLKLAIQTSRQAKMKTIQWKKTPNRIHDRHWCHRSLVVLIRLHTCLASHLIQYTRNTVAIASCSNRCKQQLIRRT